MPKTTEAMPHALGRIPMLICPSEREIAPGMAEIALDNETVNPADATNASIRKIESSSPNVPDRATAPTPYGIK